MGPLHYLSLSEVARRIKSGELTSEHVVDETLKRIAEHEPDLKSFARLLPDEARADAHLLDQERAAGKPLGALHGVPIGVKDLLYTRGIPTASGTTVMADFIPQIDATVITRLKAAGAVLIGKTQLTEGAFGAHHPSIEPPVNPWHPDYFTGVSSSGSGVSVAAGLAYGALGSDTGGSIRFPSACCGLVGLKPTYGLVSRYGAFALAQSLDHIGPMTRTVEDAARMLGVIAGVDPEDPTTYPQTPPNYAAMLDSGVEGMRIGVDYTYVSSGTDAGMSQLISDALRVFTDLGATVSELTIPASHRRLVEEWAITCGRECAQAHRDYYPARKDEYGPGLAGLIELGLGVDDAHYADLENERERFRKEFDQLFADVDLFVCPCMPTPVPSLARFNEILGSDAATADFLTFTAPFDYSGHPTLTLPMRIASNGLPEAFQLVGRTLGEPTLFRAGAAFERACDFDQHPIP
jgi:amidase